MIGMHQHTGRSLQGMAHLQQSIAMILTTPSGSRLMRRDFGSEVFALIDAPSQPDTRVKLYAAVATALMPWEPRLRLTQVQYHDASPSAGCLDIEGIGLNTGGILLGLSPAGSQR